MCDGTTVVTDYLLALGYVTVAPGEPCPAVEDAQLQVDGCTFIEWQGITCALDQRRRPGVRGNDGYGGYYANATTAPTSTTYTTVSPDVVDVCYYQGVFYDARTRRPPAAARRC